MTPLVSIIIPAYNAEKYLGGCVESIISQSMTDWELILVNDGSKDSTPQLCEKYTDSDSRIKFISQTNHGVSVSRNVGLNIAKGMYVMFIDSDDLLPSCSLEKFQSLAKKFNNPDLIRGEYSAIDENGNFKFKSKVKTRGGTSQFEPAKDDTFCRFIGTEYFLWLLWIRRDIITGNAILFSPQRCYMEDAEFLIKLSPYIRNYCYLADSIYNYRKHDRAATSIIDRRKISDVVDILKFINSIYANSTYNNSSKTLDSAFISGFNNIVAYLLSMPIEQGKSWIESHDLKSSVAEFLSSSRIENSLLQSFIESDYKTFLGKQKKILRRKEFVRMIYHKIADIFR